MPTPAPLILASQSPRRAQLLRDAGIVFEQWSPPYADPDQPPGHLRGDEAEGYAQSLAVEKARSLADVIDGPAVILSADTICVDASGQLVGKPTDIDHARAMLLGFVQASHRVISGVALLTRGADAAGVEQSFADTATVTFGRVSAEQIQAYLDSGDWAGKAGGYNLFDRQAAGWAITVVGDPATVVGLPMQMLMPRLEVALNSSR